ncbi:MAG: BtrH N-terminal domain-containing protein [Ardenticatenaceae bacterium]|nr:BtrH N-terminal domain-containing protein [Ardenticatenaceae bacterium]
MAVLANFQHFVGNHCSSTSIADVTRFDGSPISEAMAFGIGAGLGFFYIHDDGSPTHRFNGRAPQLEWNFYHHIGRPLQWENEWNLKKISDYVNSSRPVLAVTDIFHLPYYQPQVHFAGHGVVVVGVDLEKETVDIADIADPQPITVPAEVLKNAMGEAYPPLLEPYWWAAAPDTQGITVTRQAIIKGLNKAAEVMLSSPSPEIGLPAMKAMIEALPTWQHAPDWQWAARFGYQGIEKRGTGGGGFRKMYAGFLLEAVEQVPELSKLKAVDRMRRSSDLWSDLAQEFKQIFIGKNAAGFATCQAVLREIFVLESDLMQTFATL